MCSQHCKYGDKDCIRTTGRCFHGCKHGWSGLLCDEGKKNLLNQSEIKSKKILLKRISTC